MIEIHKSYIFFYIIPFLMIHIHEDKYNQNMQKKLTY